jgi:hypothetical protein
MSTENENQALPDQPPVQEPAASTETAAAAATAETKVETAPPAATPPSPATEMDVKDLALALQASNNKIEHVSLAQYKALVAADLVNRSLRCLKTGKPLEITTPVQE